MSGGYVIQLGNEQPSEAIVATPNKKTGDPVGEQMTTYKRVGAHLLINRARVWGRRVINGKPKADGSEIEFNTAGYKGEIEFLEWGTNGGYAIDIRYLPQSRSLDYEYQHNVQKVIVDPNQSEVHITLKAGQNKFDHKKDDLLISFLRVYPQNRDSKSKNPDPSIKGYQYYELTDEHVDKKAVETIENSIDAGSFVKAISTKTEKLRNLLKVLGKREEFGTTDLLSVDAEIYKTLLRYASNNADNFNYWISEYKKTVTDAFEKAESYKALDLTKNGHIGWDLDGKKHLLFSDVEAKGKGMVDWVIENYLEDSVFNATQILKELVSKLK